MKSAYESTPEMTKRAFQKKYQKASSDAYFALADAVEHAMRGQAYQVSRRHERFVKAFLTAFTDASGDEIASMANAAGQRRFYGLGAFL